MNVLDENIVVSQRELLRSWKIHFRRIGGEIGRLGMKDHEDIIPLLHTLQRPTFFTHDHGFYRPTLLHAGYCLVYLEVGADEIAEYIRHLLRHQAFRRRSQRMGKIVRVRHSGGSYWQIHQKGEQSLSW
ncbi:MAG: hypothetical protein HY268_17010 [Deltaproteobacteria bacterium]|nr:hypothetical protein [Deltaproteobacteria bacterium]